jgi:hypothetical protein
LDRSLGQGHQPLPKCEACFWQTSNISDQKLRELYRLSKNSKKVNEKAMLNEVAYRNFVGPNFLPLQKIRPGRMLKDSHKHIDELAVGRNFLKALGLSDNGLESGPHNLPPDLIFKHGNKLVGIENTSLGGSPGEIESKKNHLDKTAKSFASTSSPNRKLELESQFNKTLGELRALEFWEKEFFLSRLHHTISEKNLNYEGIKAAKGYEENWLFISLHGANLTKAYVPEYLKDQRFSSEVYCRVWVKLEYDPELKNHPIYELSIEHDGID